MTNLSPNSFPDLSGLGDLLSPWAGKRAFIVPMTDAQGHLLGNNGDRLMHSVFRSILREFEIEATTEASAAQVVIVPPNGALLEIYSFPKILAARLVGLEQIPLVIFPSSAYFDTVNPAFMFSNRSAPTLWIFRENFSLRLVRDKWGPELTAAGVSFALDHDVVAAGHKFVPNLFSGKNRRRASALVAGRIDQEGSAIGAAKVQAPPANHLSSTLRAGVEAIPYGRLRTAVTRTARRNHLALAGQQLLSRLPSEMRDLVGVSPRYLDSSADQYATFDEYLDSIASSDIVVTNRLHVALPAAIMGKRVVMVEAGYHKLGGVYEQSLSAASNVTFVP